jgi:hypothetical protein
MALISLAESLHKRSTAGDSGPNEQQLRLLAKAKGLDPDEFVAEHLVSVDLPSAYRYLWNIYRSLANRRCWADGNPQAITFTEIASFAQMTRTPLDAWEVAIITALDDYERGLILEARNKAQSRPNNR